MAKRIYKKSNKKRGKSKKRVVFVTQWYAAQKFVAVAIWQVRIHALYIQLLYTIFTK